MLWVAPRRLPCRRRLCQPSGLAPQMPLGAHNNSNCAAERKVQAGACKVALSASRLFRLCSLVSDEPLQAPHVARGRLCS